MTIENWRKRVRAAHGIASTGCPKAVGELGRLMAHKRRHELPALKARHSHDDAKVWATYLECGRNSLMTALKLGYHLTYCRKRLTEIKKARRLE